MKSTAFWGVVLTAILITSIGGCKKDDDNPVEQTVFSGKASDYLPPAGPKAVTIRMSGSATEYDSLGNVTESYQVTNQTVSGTIEAATIVGLNTATPITGIDTKNRKVLAGYLFLFNGDAMFAPNDNYAGSIPSLILLPSELSVGKEWTLGASSKYIINTKLKLAEYLKSYTNSAGVAYQNVIRVTVTYKDSTVKVENYTNYSMNLYSYVAWTGDVYFAKGTGFIDAKITNYDKLLKYTETDYGRVSKYYNREKMAATASFSY